jgi:hypothetical protein
MKSPVDVQLGFGCGGHACESVSRFYAGILAG